MAFGLLGAVANQAGAVPIVATGGTKTTSGDYTIHTFTGSGTFEVTEGAGDVDVFVVAGGAAGGGWSSANWINSGGGGAGGAKATTGIAVEVGSYTVTIGAGSSAYNTSGSNSSFASTVSTGGGHAAWAAFPAYYPTDAYAVAASGGSGGGGTSFIPGSGSAVPPLVAGGSGTPGQGYPGGTAVQPNPGQGSASAGGGGGGGSGGNGVQPGPYATALSGNGGSGVVNSYPGSPVTYAGGGGGGNSIFSPAPMRGTGGSGGGGDGATQTVDATNGATNTGSGGGGGERVSGDNYGQGGSGIVIVRYLTAG